MAPTKAIKLVKWIRDNPSHKSAKAKAHQLVEHIVEYSTKFIGMDEASATFRRISNHLMEIDDIWVEIPPAKRRELSHAS